MPKDADQKTKQNKTKQKQSLSSQRSRKREAYQNRKLLEINHITAPKYYRKKKKTCGPTYTKASKGQVENVDFYPHQAI